MKNYTLYGLRKPGEEARYIGITSGTLDTRLERHFYKRTEDHRGRWLDKARSENLTIEIIPYCVGLSEKEACELEIGVIAELRKQGVDLVNTSPGGNFPHIPWGNKNASGKNLGNKFALGNTHSLEWKSETSKKLIGNKNSLGKNLGNKNASGYKHSQVAKEKMSEKRAGRTPALGSKHSQESKEIVSFKLKLHHEKKRQEETLEEMWR